MVGPGGGRGSRAAGPGGGVGPGRHRRRAGGAGHGLPAAGRPPAHVRARCGGWRPGCWPRPTRPPRRGGRPTSCATTRPPGRWPTPCPTTPSSPSSGRPSRWARPSPGGATCGCSVVDVRGEAGRLVYELDEAGADVAAVAESGLGAAVLASTSCCSRPTPWVRTGWWRWPGRGPRRRWPTTPAVPVWVVAGVGRVLPDRLWDALAARLDEVGRAVGASRSSGCPSTWST